MCVCVCVCGVIVCVCVGVVGVVGGWWVGGCVVVVSDVGWMEWVDGWSGGGEGVGGWGG